MGRQRIDPDAPVRFAVIGCGMLARSQHIPNIAASDKMVLQVCCDLDPRALAECRDKHGARRLTTDMADAVADPQVDAVCLATTQNIRLQPVELAARFGKPIYIEKPVADLLPELYRIRDLVQQSGIPCCVGHNRRCSPAMIDAQRIFRQHLRQPRSCPWRYDREGEHRPRFAFDGVAGMSVRINDDWHSWKANVFDPVKCAHGPMVFEMTHFTDLCNWFLQGQPVEVMAMEFEKFNTGCIIRYAGGEMATISMCASGTFAYGKERYEAMGHGGIVTVEHMVEVRTAGIPDAPARTPYAMLNDKHPHIGAEGGYDGWLAKRAYACQQAAAAGDPLLQFTAEPDKGHARALDRFVDEIRGQGPVVCGIDEAVLASEVAFAAELSARRKQAVRIAELRQNPHVFG